MEYGVWRKYFSLLLLGLLLLLFKAVHPSETLLGMGRSLELFAEVKNFYSSPSTGIIRHKLCFAKLAPGGLAGTPLFLCVGCGLALSRREGNRGGLARGPSLGTWPGT